jgi:peptidoglycan-associated lipoprotein
MTRIILSSFSFRGLMVMELFAVIVLAGCGPTYPKCDNDNDCHAGEFCVNGMCQQCRSDGDCGKGQQCTAGRCEAMKGYCTTTSDCSSNEQCQSNRCVPKTEPVVSEATGADVSSGPCTLQNVYFDFDSSDLKSDTRETLSRDAECARERHIDKLHVTGYTDPRGTEEYNLALGDQRAQSVSKYLKSLDSDVRISHSSVGKEMAKGTDDSGWALDRRAEFRQE